METVATVRLLRNDNEIGSATGAENTYASRLRTVARRPATRQHDDAFCR